MILEDFGQSATQFQATTFLDLCYRYGISPASRMTLPSVPIESHLSQDWSTVQSLSSSELIRQMRYAMEPSVHHHIRSATYEAILDWLKFYSIMELAVFVQAVPSPLPETFTLAALEELGVHQNATYIEAGFPLVAMFHLRLKGKHNVTHEDSPHARPLLGRLLTLDAAIRHDTSMREFFSLSRFTRMTEEDRQVITDLFSQPEHGLEHIKELAHGEDKLSLIIEGTWMFFDFCKELHFLLRTTKNEYPELASGIRLFYAHILDRASTQATGALTQTIHEVIVGLTRWATFFKNEEALERINNLTDILGDLSSIDKWPIPDDWAIELGLLVAEPA